MARGRRKQYSKDVEPLDPQQRTLPDRCPLCQESLPAATLEATTHLQSRAPVELCARCDQKDKGWRLDWDNVKYPRPDMSFFFCSGCGRYPPMNVGEEVSPSGEA
jgi:hypothetical protein